MPFPESSVQVPVVIHVNGSRAEMVYEVLYKYAHSERVPCRISLLDDLYAGVLVTILVTDGMAQNLMKETLTESPLT